MKDTHNKLPVTLDYDPVFPSDGHAASQISKMGSVISSPRLPGVVEILGHVKGFRMLLVSDLRFPD